MLRLRATRRPLDPPVGPIQQPIQSGGLGALVRGADKAIWLQSQFYPAIFVSDEQTITSDLRRETGRTAFGSNFTERVAMAGKIAVRRAIWARGVALHPYAPALKSDDDLSFGTKFIA
jgi:hypothetical protein